MGNCPPGHVPVICFHGWLPRDGDNIERCKHCGLAYEIVESWMRGSAGKLGKSLSSKRIQIHSGDPKKANVHRPPECGDGDGHPEPIAFVLEEKAIEWGVWPLPKMKKEEKPVVTTIQAPAVTKKPDNDTEKAPGSTVPAKTPHASAKGLTRQEKHKFITEFKDNILTDAGKLGRTDAALLWGISVSAIDALRVGEPAAPRKSPKKGKARAKSNSKLAETQAPLPPPKAPAKYPPKWDGHTCYIRCFKLKSIGGSVTLRVDGNMMNFNRDDCDFVLGIRDQLERYVKPQEAAKPEPAAPAEEGRSNDQR